jgi:hypothetical protein
MKVKTDVKPGGNHSSGGVNMENDNEEQARDASAGLKVKSGVKAGELLGVITKIDVAG